MKTYEAFKSFREPFESLLRSSGWISIITGAVLMCGAICLMPVAFEVYKDIKRFFKP